MDGRKRKNKRKDKTSIEYLKRSIEKNRRIPLLPRDPNEEDVYMELRPFGRVKRSDILYFARQRHKTREFMEKLRTVRQLTGPKGNWALDLSERPIYCQKCPLRPKRPEDKERDEGERYALDNILYRIYCHKLGRYRHIALCSECHTPHILSFVPSKNPYSVTCGILLTEEPCTECESILNINSPF